MKKFLFVTLALVLLFALAVPAMAAADTYAAKTAALSLSVSYDNRAFLGDNVEVNVTVTKPGNGAIDYRVKAGDFDSGHQTYKNNEAPKTFTFYVDCTKTGTANLTVVLEEWQNKNKMNKAVEIVVTISVECPGHDFINDTGVVIKERTCDEDGAVEAACSRLGCDAVGVRFLPAHNSWDEGVVTAPTCTEEGFTTYTCKFEYGCGKTKTGDVVPVLGHNFNQWKKTTIQERTCTVEGIYAWPCDNDGCNETYEQILPGSHFMNDRGVDWSVWKLVDIAPTCTEDGFYGYVCCVCAEEAEDAETIPATGHKWSMMAIAHKAATCTEDGFNSYSCTNGCGKFDIVTIPATGHTRVETNTPATCTEPGERSAECKTCGANLPTFATNPPALGHSWNEGIYTSPSRTADGFTTYTCTVDGCDATDVVTDEDSKWVVTGATAAIIEKSGNDFKIQVTETYSGGPNEVYTSATISGNQAISNNSSADFTVGPYTVTVARGSGTYTVTAIK